MRETISCAVVVRNEERNIRDCLESAKWMDEIIVVDAYSTDRTVEIAKEFTPKVFQRSWKGFGDQKNYATDQATCQWVFILDADERITPELRQKMENILASAGDLRAVAFYVPRRNFYYGKWIRNAGCYPDYQLRLFRKGVGRLDDAEPHNRFVFKGQAERLDQPLDHYTERTVKDRFLKLKNFTTLAAKEKAKTKTSVSALDLLIRPVFTFYKYYVRRKGFRDGLHGYLLCAFASMYTFVKYAKLWDMTRGSGEGNSYDRPARRTGAMR